MEALSNSFRYGGKCSMTQAEQLAHRIEEVLLNGTWTVNTNRQEQNNQTDHIEAVSFPQM